MYHISNTAHKIYFTTGEVGGDNGGRVSRNNYKGHMDKRRVKVKAREGGGFGWCGGIVVGEEMQTTVIEQQ